MFINNFDPVAFQIFSFEIRWYSLAYIFGIIFGWFYCKKNLIKDKKLLNLFDDLITYLIIGIILGGRIGYVIFYNLEYYLDNFFEILMIWKGGMSFHGGLLGVIVSIFIFSKNKNKNFFKYSDVVACVAPIGLFLGRIANFINGELFGKIAILPWAIIFPNGGNISRHPSQIYEAILEGIVLFILINFFNAKKFIKIKRTIPSKMAS
jgi:phosphatidylglycerol:prolipoprotein diacylglycerol transferase